jgi:hypothetical protein
MNNDDNDHVYDENKLMILDKRLETEDQPAGFITEVKDMNESTYR